MANSKRKCKHCKKFVIAEKGAALPVGFFCSIEHAVKWACARDEADREKIKRKIHRERRIANRGRSWYLEEAQTWFNRYIRIRDALEPCISCERYHRGQWHAGHFRSVGAASQLRFNEMNVHKQCVVCNRWRSGNIGEYRPNLIKKIGLDQVEALESNHEKVTYSIEYLKELIIEYKKKCKK